MTRAIDAIIIRCSATPPGLDIGAAEIRRWRVSPPSLGRGWDDIGYRHVIRRDGAVEPGRPEAIPGARLFDNVCG